MGRPSAARDGETSTRGSTLARRGKQERQPGSSSSGRTRHHSTAAATTGTHRDFKFFKLFKVEKSFNTRQVTKLNFKLIKFKLNFGHILKFD